MVDLTARQELVRLIQQAVKGCAAYWAGLIADHLLANGVCVPTNKGTGWIANAADVVPVVRCKDCKHYTNFDVFRCKKLDIHWCKKFENVTKGDDYCSYGERRSG